MNTSENPPLESPSSSRRNPCLDDGIQLAALNVFTDDGISYLLPYAQFLHAERTPNPALEKDPDVSPEKMLIRFASAEVLVLGSGLKTLERMLQKSELKFVKSADRRAAVTLQTHIAVITLTFTKDTP